MISVKDLVETCRGIELLSYGIDITQLDSLKQYYNTKEKRLQTKVSPNIIHKAVIKLGEDVSDFIQWPIGTYFIRDDSEWLNVFEDSLTDEEKSLKVISVDKNTFKEVMKILKMKGVAGYSDIDITEYYPEYYDDMCKERATFDFKDLTGCSMPEELSLAECRDNLIAMLMCSDYPKDIGTKIIEAYDNPDKDFEINALKDYEVIDNRIYIKIPECDKSMFKSNVSTHPLIENVKYIVISRNPYDYFFCSYGSNIQSCYSINGINYGWYGMVPMSAVKGNYIIYGADSKCNKINIINGKKWNVPHMYFRAWGWLSSDNKLLVDRMYPDGSWSLPDRNELLQLLSPFLGYDCMTLKKDQRTSLKYGKAMKDWYESYRGHMYPDSVDMTGYDEVIYKGICRGNRSFIGHCPLTRSLLNIMHDISSIADGIKYDTDYTTINGVLANLRRCPITRLPMLPEETTSQYAKYFKEPLTGELLVGTFIDGYFKADACTLIKGNDSTTSINYVNCNGGSSNRDGNGYWFYDMFSHGKIPIKVFKEQMTGMVKTSAFDNVLIRYVENDRVTYVKYRKK